MDFIDSMRDLALRIPKQCAGIQTEEANVPAPTDYISLKGDEHPNQAAIDQAMLLAMEAYENNESQDLRV